jgi:beta-glucosidase
MEKEETYVKRAKEYLAKMSVKEKVSLLFGDKAWHTYGVNRLSLKGITMHDGPLGLRAVPESNASLLDGASEATCFPAPCLTACSFDPKVTESIGKAMGREAAMKETNLILAPGVNIKRNPLCGRNFEYLSEDPLLAGKMASGFINGCQSQGIGVSLKHFALNNQETYRVSYSAEVDARALREIYLKPFEIAVKEAKPWTVMCSYNQINGVFSSDNDQLLNGILRSEWGFEGVVISDWGAANDPIRSHNHGMDLEMPCFVNRVPQLTKAYKKGVLLDKVLKEEATRLIALDLKANEPHNYTKAYNYGMGHDVARKAATESMVLLKNDHNALPLKNYNGCCVIGALASEPRYQGAGSSQVIPVNLVSFLKAANSNVKEGQELPYAPGYSLLKSNEDAAKLSLEAVDLASSVKTVILFLGLPASYESEGFDRKHMNLPNNQIELFNAIYSVNKNIIVVLSAGAPVELPFSRLARAILLAYLPGEAGGSAINDLLLGLANPSGKLAESWPIHYNDVPSHSYWPGDEHHSLYRESVYVGYRYYLTSKTAVLYPFGYGLSYSKFAYKDLKVSSSTPLSPKKHITISFKLQNTSKVDGEEVVQLYSNPQGGKVFKPLRELRAFDKIALKAGASKVVSFTLNYEDLSHFDEVDERNEVEAGSYRLEVASSSEKVELSTVIKVISSDTQMDKKTLLPSYYLLSKKGVLEPSPDEFERLLGHKVTTPKKKHYDLNSTLGDISSTWIGKVLLKVGSKPQYAPNNDKETMDDYIQMLKETPIRMLGIAGIKERHQLAIIALANHRPFKALFDVAFGKRR